MAIKLALFDNGPSFEVTLVLAARSAADISFVGSFALRSDLVDACRQFPPDIVFAGVELLGNDSALPELMGASPGLRFVLLAPAQFRSGGLILELMRAGACGCILRSAPAAELQSIIRLVFDGGIYLAPETVRALNRCLDAALPNAPMRARLTEREREIMNAVAAGKKEKEIASDFGISTDTAHTHIKNIFRKLEVHNRAEAIREYLRRPSLLPEE